MSRPSGDPSADAQETLSSSTKPSTLGKAFSKLDLDGHDLPPSPAPSSPRNGRKYALATELVYTDSGDQYNASSVPIYQVREPGGAIWSVEGTIWKISGEYMDGIWSAHRIGRTISYLDTNSMAIPVSNVQGHRK